MSATGDWRNTEFDEPPVFFSIPISVTLYVYSLNLDMEYASRTLSIKNKRKESCAPFRYKKHPHVNLITKSDRRNELIEDTNIKVSMFSIAWGNLRVGVRLGNECL